MIPEESSRGDQDGKSNAIKGRRQEMVSREERKVAHIQLRYIGRALIMLML